MINTDLYRPAETQCDAVKNQTETQDYILITNYDALIIIYS